MRSSAHARYCSWPQPSSPSCPSQAPTASAYTPLANLTRIIWLRGSKRRMPSSSTHGMLDTGQRILWRKERNLHTRKTVSIPVLVVDAAPHLLRRPQRQNRSTLDGPILLLNLRRSSTRPGPHSSLLLDNVQMRTHTRRASTTIRISRLLWCRNGRPPDVSLASFTSSLLQLKCHSVLGRPHFKILDYKEAMLVLGRTEWGIYEAAAGRSGCCSSAS